MLKSKRVYEERQQYVGIRVPAGASEEEHAAAIAELELFRKERCGKEAEDPRYAITSTDSYGDVFSEPDGSTHYRFPAMYQMNGTDYNNLIYPDAVYATDLIK